MAATVDGSDEQPGRTGVKGRPAGLPARPERLWAIVDAGGGQRRVPQRRRRTWQLEHHADPLQRPLLLPHSPTRRTPTMYVLNIRCGSADVGNTARSSLRRRQP
jgi:hypothetical protein